MDSDHLMRQVLNSVNPSMFQPVTNQPTNFQNSINIESEEFKPTKPHQKSQQKVMEPDSMFGEGMIGGTSGLHQNDVLEIEFNELKRFNDEKNSKFQNTTNSDKPQNFEDDLGEMNENFGQF